ncbi:hypothetical protein DY000_02047342 [Brassica cretica]|uniref:Uncharacterized protein n=1 Tax=Brassica cretica TaxID=69181 RepID=A0ABQ7EZH8_BRACR|nr:hypothetical protein DY000_02047342 [Brassica cretica]
MPCVKKESRAAVALHRTSKDNKRWLTSRSRTKLPPAEATRRQSTGHARDPKGEKMTPDASQPKKRSQPPTFSKPSSQSHQRKRDTHRNRPRLLCWRKLEDPETTTYRM